MNQQHGRRGTTTAHLAVRRREVNIAAQAALQQLLKRRKKLSDGRGPLLWVQEPHTAACSIALSYHVRLRNRNAIAS